jgi:CheY-like chemotaxis protein
MSNEARIEAMVTSSTDETPRNDRERQVPELPFPGRVLLVDDMYDDAALLALLLAPLEVSVVVAQSADEALEIVNRQVVDLVVTDLNMPGPSGLDLARVIQTQRDGPTVIFMTGSPRSGDRVAAFELGAVAYLQKPVNVEYLIGLVRETLLSRCLARVHAAAVKSSDATGEAS